MSKVKAICINNKGYEKDLKLDKVYTLLIVSDNHCYVLGKKSFESTQVSLRRFEFQESCK